MPAHRKRPDQGGHHQGAPKKPALVVAKLPSSRQPTATRGWRKSTKDAWADYWASDVSGASEAVDMPTLRRLFTMRDVQAECWARYEGSPYVDGSKGQPVANPALDDALKLERAIVALEDRMGLSAKSRANLSMAIGQAALTAKDLNEMARGDDADSDQDIVDAEIVGEWEDAGT